MREAADAAQLGAPRRWARNERTVVVDYGGPALAVTPLGAGTARIRFSAEGRFAPRRSWAVTRPDDDFPPPELTVDEDDRGIRVASEELVVLVRAGARVDVLDREGRVLLADGDGGPSWADDGSETAWVKDMPDDERYYGFGERMGLLEKRGRRFTCWTTDEWRHQGPTTDELYVAVPFFLGLTGDGRSYGVFLDSTFRSTFDLSDLAGRTMCWRAAQRELGFYVFNGPDPGQVLERFTELVGRMPLPPRWALGFHQSRWGYESAEEVLAIAREFRRRRIPADALHLDLDHMDDARVLTWSPERFADPEGLVIELRELGFRAVTLVGAGVMLDPGYDVYADGHRRDVFLRTSRDPDAPEFTAHVWPGLCAFPDHVRSDVRAWWGSRYRGHVDLGVAGFLNDMNEPAMHDRPMDDPGTENLEPPLELPHGPDDEPVTHAEARNVYAYLENRGTYEFLRHARPEERPFLLSRSGYAGMQRYAGVWTGDLWSVWEHLEASLPQLLNLGLSGMPLAGADIGGFFDSCGPELLVRWTQLGALTPFARNHSATGTAPQEPWAWGERAEAACRRAIELRYRLLPYLYTVFEEASRTGMPVLRPLFLHYATDPATHLLADEALLGRDLLLAPVVRPGVEARSVYLPEGTWTDVRSGARHEGPGWALTSARLDEDLPLFARGGAIVPYGPVLQWTDERPVDEIELEIFPAPDGAAEGALYEDDGTSFAYERGAWRRTTFRFEEFTLTAHADGGFEPPARRVRAIVRGAEEREIELA